VESTAGSAPVKLVQSAIEKEKELGARSRTDRVWFVIDTDRWRAQLHRIRQECGRYPHWRVAQSNPCFEVWLYFHAKNNLPETQSMGYCNNWKLLLPNVIQGGFNSDFHPIAIETAITNSKNMYVENGYLPEPGSTQLWQLGEELLPIIKKDLEDLKGRFPVPVVIS
jgi:hypothetical protein